MKKLGITILISLLLIGCGSPEDDTNSSPSSRTQPLPLPQPLPIPQPIPEIDDPGPLDPPVEPGPTGCTNTASNTTVFQDFPKEGDEVKMEFDIAGWAMDTGDCDGTGVTRVDYWAQPGNRFLGSVTYGGDRPDVATDRFRYSGFGLHASLPVGNYTLVATAFSTVLNNFAFAVPKITNIKVVAPVPNTQAVVDFPKPGDSINGSFIAGGWALDLGAVSGVGVNTIHIWARDVQNPLKKTMLGAVTEVHRNDRSDLPFKPQFLHSGFTITISLPALPAGPYVLEFYVFNLLLNDFDFNKVIQVPVTVL